MWVGRPPAGTVCPMPLGGRSVDPRRSLARTEWALEGKELAKDVAEASPWCGRRPPGRDPGPRGRRRSGAGHGGPGRGEDRPSRARSTASPRARPRSNPTMPSQRERRMTRMIPAPPRGHARLRHRREVIVRRPLPESDGGPRQDRLSSVVIGSRVASDLRGTGDPHVLQHCDDSFGKGAATPLAREGGGPPCAGRQCPPDGGLQEADRMTIELALIRA
jgi:hypothetical protein